MDEEIVEIKSTITMRNWCHSQFDIEKLIKPFFGNMSWITDIRMVGCDDDHHTYFEVDIHGLMKLDAEKLKEKDKETYVKDKVEWWTRLINGPYKVMGWKYTYNDAKEKWITDVSC